EEIYTIASIGDGAFDGHSELIGDLIIPKGITQIGKAAFYGCSGLNGNLIIPDGVTSIGDSAFAYCSGVTGDLAIPSSVINIGYGAFQDCRGLNGNVKIGDNVTSIGPVAFYNCSGLIGDLMIPDSVTSIGYNAFGKCSGLDGILKLSENIVSIENNTFNGCSSLAGDLTIPSGVINIGEFAFYKCSRLMGEIILPNTTTSIGKSAFEGCDGLTGSLIIPDAVESIGERAFALCSGFDGELILPSGIELIGGGAFFGCSGLIGSLVIPESIIRIEGTTFYGCKGLSGDLVIPESIISIGNSAFTGCSGLTGELVIPNSVANIHDSAFARVGNLSRIGINYGNENIENKGYNEWKKFVGERLNMDESRIKSGYIFNKVGRKAVKGEGIETPDVEAPVLNYTGPTTITIDTGSNFTPPEVTATDNKDGSVGVTYVIRNSNNEMITAIDTRAAGTYTITYSAEDAAGNEATPLVITVVVKEALPVIEFKDTNFKQALIDEGLDRDNDGEITIQEMEQITELWIQGKQIKDISEIKYAKNLEKLYVAENQIADISMLIHLPSLQTLQAPWNQITDISMLPQIKTLTDINLSGNNIGNIDVFENMPWIKSLGLYTCGIQDIGVLRQLPKIEELFIGNNAIDEMEIIGELNSLKALSLPSSDIEDFDFISKLIKLEELYLSDNKIKHLEGIENLKNLEFLSLENNLINNLSLLPIKKYKHLNVANNYLNINENSSTMQILKQIEEFGGEIRYTPQKSVDAEAPVLKYTGDTKIIIKNGSEFVVPKVVATDNEDESVVVNHVIKDSTSKIITVIDTKIAGTYTVTYTAADQAGNEANPLVITVVVEDVSGGNSSGAGGGGGTSVKPPTTEESIDKLNSDEKHSIINNFKEDMPYTSLNTQLTLDQLKQLTNNKFTDKQLQEMLDRPELIEKLGIDQSLLSSCVVLNLAENVTFTDVPETHWANDSIKLAAELGLVSGRPDGTFEPSASLQVADTFTFLDRVLLLNGITEMKLPRSIVEKYISNKEHWAFASMASIGSKLSETTLKVVSELGEEDLSRELLAQVIYEVTNGKLEMIKEEIIFEDIADSPYKEAVDYCTRVGILNGIDPNRMAPQKVLTRAELMSVLTRLVQVMGGQSLT
ncbi:MAG: leucine-rich repeat protein, partial [Cellulosilyticaceae bacterium]